MLNDEEKNMKNCTYLFEHVLKKAQQLVNHSYITTCKLHNQNLEKYNYLNTAKFNRGTIKCIP